MGETVTGGYEELRILQGAGMGEINENEGKGKLRRGLEGTGEKCQVQIQY